MPNAWKVVGASAIGSSHLRTGTECQDSFAQRVTQAGRLVGVVSDGAGSASRSAEGSELLARRLVDGLADAVISDVSDLTAWRLRIIDLVARVRDCLVATYLASEFEDSGLNVFAATVVGAVVEAQGGFFFHIGDGLGIATRTEALEFHVISPPENGQFIEETYFFTDENWREHLRFTSIPADFDLILLMSDGAMPFVAKRTLAPFEGFVDPVTRYLRDLDTETGAKALHATLCAPRTESITSDDKTLLWALRLR
jgi:hypothetical protein